MTRVNRLFLTFFLVTLMLLGAKNPAWAQNPTILEISNPFKNKTPFALPNFAALGPSPKAALLATEARDLLERTLLFTGYFRMVNPDAFLETPSRTGIDESSIHFDRWRSTGSELLITGSLAVSGQSIVGEFHFYDIFRAKSLFGVRYRTTISNLRPMILRLADKIMLTYSGKRSCFSSRIAFISNASGVKEVYVCDFDAHKPVKVSANNAITLTPSWSPDGKKLAYTSYVHGKPDVFTQGAWPGAKRNRLTSKGTTNITPSWSPNGKNLAASLTIKGDQAIYLLTQKGKIRKRLTRKWSKWGIDVSPVFSPSGDQIAFVSKRSGTPQIYIKNLRSGRTERLTFDGRYNTSPAWSPSGDRIAYAGSHNGHFDIYVIDIREGKIRQLTFDSGDNETPSWSPDGNLIVFSSNRSGKNALYVMNAYGTDQRKLATLPGEQTAPVWSPNLKQ